jgi:nitrite reductase/ring-hydroxylating ferredoxin subunit
MCDQKQAEQQPTEDLSAAELKVPQRRGFFRWIGQAAVALFFLPHPSAWAKKIGLDLQKTAELKAPGTAKLINYKGTQILLVHDRKGGVHAINNTCTHKKCKVAYKASTDSLFCKCHRSAFKLNGAVVAGPAPRPLTTYPARRQGKLLVVDVP